MGREVNERGVRELLSGEGPHLGGDDSLAALEGGETGLDDNELERRQAKQDQGGRRGKVGKVRLRPGGDWGQGYKGRERRERTWSALVGAR